MSKYSEACCKIPPAEADNYQTKGKYIELDGVKTYVTGPEDADTAILSIFDIFGFYNQTLQGADILAYADKHKPYQVFIPDFFDGNPCPIEWYPPDNDDKKAKLGEWFKGVSPDIQLPKVPKFLAAAEKVNPNIKTWGAIGYCWGGKMVAIIASKEKKIKAAVQTSPAMVDVSDAEKTVIPMAVLASKDEDEGDIKKYDELLKTEHHVEYFGDQLHGFMSARADLKDERVKAEYERGYQIAANFLRANL